MPSVVVADEIRRVSEGLQLPDTIREFLDGPWQQVLSHAFAQQGEQSLAWKTSLQTMHDLVWSVKPNTTPKIVYRWSSCCRTCSSTCVKA